MKTYLSILASVQAALAEKTEFFSFEVQLAGEKEQTTIGELTDDCFATIVTNVASEWGVTKMNYESLEELHSQYKSMGLCILAFPCNQFGK